MKKTTACRKLSYLILLLPLVFLLSCEKDPDLVGMDVTPAQDQLYASMVDTFTIEAYSVKEDSLSSGYTSYNMAGGAYDPVFGRANSAFATQFMLSTVNPSFGNNPVMDSLVLILPYSTYYGDTNTLQTFHVYELEEDLSADSTYYSNRTVKHKGVDYAHAVFYPRPTDSLLLDTSRVAPQLRLNLGKIRPELSQKLLYAPSGSLATNAEFVKYFKGLAISADPVSYGGSILYFNLQSANTRFRMYYHNDEEDSLHYDLLVTEKCVRFNMFTHYNYDFASQAFRKQVIYKDTTLGNQVLYLQAMSGTKIRMKFPSLKQWAGNRKIAINEAKLILPVYEDSPGLPPVSDILPVLVDQDGTYSSLPDVSGGESYFGGKYVSESNQYVFRITQYVQNILKENYVDRGMYLLASGASARATRVLLAGTKHPSKPMKLRVTYSYLH